MDVVPFERLRYWVESRSSDRYWLVDLAAYNGNGWCGCPHFQYRLHPLLSRGADGVLRCHHIQAARAFCSEAILQSLIQKENSQ